MDFPHLSRMPRNSSQRRERILLAATLGTLSAILGSNLQALHTHASDFAQVWYAARAFVHGENPYLLVGAGRAFDWPFPLLYPMTAVITAVPFAAIAVRWANVAWVAVGTVGLAWGLTRERLWSPKLFVFASFAYLEAAHVAQWSPLLCAAALMPSLGFVLAAKPTLGAALFAAFPNRRALIGMVAVVVVTIALFPTWPMFWVRGLQATRHMSAPVTHVAAGGPLILLALLKWRRPEARLITALACVPQTTLLYEAVPLFLVVERWYEGLGLSILTIVAAVWTVPPQAAGYNASLWATGDVIVLSLYLPCVLFVLMRPNQHASWESLVNQVNVARRRVTFRALQETSLTGSIT
jgi:hypothetical protein